MGEFHSRQGAGAMLVAALLAMAALIALAAPAQADVYQPAGVIGGGDEGFESPHGLALDSQGNIWVADTRNHQIQKCDPAGNCTAFGSHGSGPGQFVMPSGIAVDSDDNVYVGESFTNLTNHRIQKFNSSGTLLDTWNNAEYLTGSGDMAIDGDGNLLYTQNSYANGTSQDRIVKLDPSSGEVLGTFGEPSATQPGITGNPLGVAVDGANNIYVPDLTRNDVQKFDAAGNFQRRWGLNVAGNQSPAQFQICRYLCDGDGGIASSFLSDPIWMTPGLAFAWGADADDNGHVYVSNWEGTQIYDSNGNWFGHIGGEGEVLGKEAFDVVVEPSGNNLWVADAGSVKKYHRTYAAPPQPDHLSEPDPAGKCPSKTTLRGTDGADNPLTGTSNGDRIRGMRGVDTINGLRGPDCIYGDKDGDTIDGGTGTDRIYGGPGDDTINADDGDADRVSCGSGSDTVVADPIDKLSSCENKTINP